MSTSLVNDALDRAEQRLFAQPVLESFVARREAGLTDDGDAEIAAALAGELIAHASPNGSWGDSLALTAEAVLTLAQLRPFDDTVVDAIERALSWLRTRQRAPGSFVDVCTAERHALSLCHHFAGGFFSPGPATVSLAGATLSTGALLPTDEDARLALSALALRAVLEFEPPTLDDRLQFDSLRRIAEMLFTEQSRVSMPAAVAVLVALTRAPRTASHTAILHGALSRLAGLQRADGSWPGAEGFHVADAFMIAEKAGYSSPLFDSAIVRTAELLSHSQQPDGSWSSDAGPQRLLIGWRTLRYAANLRSARNRKS
ncbi:MAG TPA: prenyltransferase/squalene oxidase repeat-containing protein [Longimicrobiales bacterium]